MAWTSLTGQFGEREISMLESMDSQSLIRALLASTPVVALRALAELLLNSDTERLAVLLANDDLSVHWLQYEEDFGVDLEDGVHAAALTEFLQQNKPA